MMNNLIKRISALLAAMILLLMLPAAQASTINWDELFGTVSAPQSGTSLIDNSEDEEEPSYSLPVPTTPAYTEKPGWQEMLQSPTATPVVLPEASADTSRIRDDADLFTAEEEAAIAQRIRQFQQSTGMDFVVMTSRKSHPGLTATQLADDYYDYGGFGLDAENSGVAYFIDMAERYHYLTTSGHMINVMTDTRIASAITSTTGYLSGGRYADAVLEMIRIVENYHRKGVPEGQFQYDQETGQILTQPTPPPKALTSTELLVSGVIAVIVGFIFYSSVHGSYKLKGNTYHYSVNENSTLHMTDTEDTYTHTTTTRVRKPDPPRSSGGGFSGGGGGSGVHIGSSGSSHGGGGGRF
ncbi:MAG: TPM domain-containing protein [Clostridia bacterium]|nr:TPM domain-containing protein [Clostridia bacterium]